MAESRKDTDAPRTWVLVDERAGTAAQSLGVAEALGIPFEQKPIKFAKSAKLPNLVLGASLTGLDRTSRASLIAPWPELVIAAGRRSAPVARWIKRQAGEGTYLAHVMFPGRGGVEAFNLIAVPRHDQHAPRPNQFSITGAPHRVTPSALKSAAADWDGRFVDAAQPRIGLLVGGATRRQAFSEDAADRLAAMTADMVEQSGGSLFVTTSRRTGKAADALAAGLKGRGVEPALFHRWGDPIGNPYLNILATADGVVVTGDSVSMCAEACATTASVYIYAPTGMVTAKHARFHQELFKQGYAEPFTGHYGDHKHERLNAADDIAREIRRQMNF